MPLHKVWGSHWHSTSCSLIERKTLAGQQITSDCTSLLHMGTGRFWWGSIVLTSLWNKVRIRKKERIHKWKSFLSVKGHVSGKDPSSSSGQCNHSIGCAVFQAIVSGKTVAEIIEFGLISDLTVAPPLTSWVTLGKFFDLFKPLFLLNVGNYKTGVRITDNLLIDHLVSICYLTTMDLVLFWELGIKQRIKQTNSPAFMELTGV